MSALRRVWEALTARDMPARDRKESPGAPTSWARRLLTAGIVVGLPGYLLNGAGRGSGSSPALEAVDTLLLTVGLAVVAAGLVVWVTNRFTG